MKTNWIIVFLALGLLTSCSSWKKTLTSKGNHNDAVKNAITDFLYSRKYVNNDSVFSVRIVNVNDEILGVSILELINKITIYTENGVDYSYKTFPTKYFEHDGKLFIWKDSTERVPPELISKLSRMNRVDTVLIGKFFSGSLSDDSRKATHYYFCKSNLRAYKKLYTSIAMGWYDPPKVKCAKSDIP